MTINWRPWAIGAALLIDAFFLFDLVGWSRLGVDFDIFRSAAARDVAEVYASDPMNPFVNPPPALFLFRPLALVSAPFAFAFWTIANVAIFAFGLTRLFDRKLVGLAMLSPIFVWALWIGQATPLLTGVAALGFAINPLFGGVLIGTMLTMKTQLLWLVVPLLLFHRDWRRLSGVVLGGFASIALSIAAFGMQPWLDWFQNLGSFRSALLTHHILWLSPSLSAQAQQFSTVLALPILILSIGLVMLAGTRVENKASCQFAFAVAASAFASPYSMPHDLVGMLPFAVSAMLSARRATATLVYLNCFLALVLAIEFSHLMFVRRDKQSRPAVDRLSSRPL